MNAGIFTQPTRQYAPMGEAPCGCSGTSKRTATGDVFGQPNDEFAVSVALWVAGATVLFFVFKDITKKKADR